MQKYSTRAEAKPTAVFVVALNGKIERNDMVIFLSKSINSAEVNMYSE